VWTGFYVGLNAGETFENHNSVDTVSVPTYHNTAVPNSAYWADNSAAGASGRTGIESRGHFIGGAQIGYNLQFNRNIIAGAEADIQALGGAGRGTSTNTRSLPLFGLYNTNNSPVADTMTTTISATKKLEYFGTLRALLGILATPILFLYGTGGRAYG